MEALQNNTTREVTPYQPTTVEVLGKTSLPLHANCAGPAD